MENNHNKAIRFLRRNGAALHDFQHPKKKEVSDILDHLSINRNNKTVKEVLDIVLQKGIVYSKNYEECISRIYQDLEGIDPEIREKIEKDKSFYESFINLSYSEIINFWKHIQNENVAVIICNALTHRGACLLYTSRCV